MTGKAFATGWFMFENGFTISREPSSLFPHSVPSSPPDRYSDVDGNVKGKRHRNDSEDEDGEVASGMEPAPHKKPIRDLFRQRMQANLKPLDS